MNNRTLLTMLLTLGFIGFSSCGNDDSKNANLAAENAALRAALAQRQNPTVVNVTNTVVATAVVNITQTAVGSGTSTGGTTVVYTVTATGSSTGTRM